MSKLRPIAVLFLCCALLPACTTQGQVFRLFPNELPTIPHRPGPARSGAETCGSYSLLGFRVSAAPDLIKTIARVVEDAGPQYNGLTDVKISEEWNLGLFYSYSCFKVEGLPVRFGHTAMPASYVPATQVPAGTEETLWNF